MAETQEIMNPYKQPLIDITPTKNVCPDHDDELVIIDIPEELEQDLETTCWIYMVPIKLRQVCCILGFFGTSTSEFFSMLHFAPGIVLAS